MFFKMAWRNLWRNPRRTTVILIAVVIGLWSLLFLNAFMRGAIEQMVENNISILTGHLKVQKTGYHSDPVIENSITQPDEVKGVLAKVLPKEARYTSRVRLQVVASNARHNAGVTLVGIDPEAEAEMSFIGDAPLQGRYLSADTPHKILAGRALVEKMETQLEYKLVLMGQDTQNEIASRAFRIRGIFDAELESTEKQYVFVLKKAAQDMLRMGPAVSEFSVLLPEGALLPGVAQALKEALPEGYRVYTWRELLPLMDAYLKMFDGFIYLWTVAVFIAMGFGLVNTILMTVYERMHEFGLLKALGMKSGWIIREVLAEAFLILVLGMAAGNGLGVITVEAMSGGLDLSAFAAGAEFAGMSRIIYPRIVLQDMLVANGVVFFLGLGVSLYPALKAARFTPVEAMLQT